MRIAVLSDTHDDFPAGILPRLRGAEEIWHLGDVTAPSIIEDLETLGVPVHVLHGNCDNCPQWPHSLTLERGGVRFHLVHIPPNDVPEGVRYVLHGHTHIPRDMKDPFGVRWLNPGSLSHPRGGFSASFAWLEVGAGRLRSWRIERV